MLNSFGQITQQHFIESNRIEGVEDLGEIPKSILAWNYLSNQIFLTNETIQEVHRILMTDLMNSSDVGVWRRCEVRVGTYICPLAFTVPELMRNFVRQFDRFLDPKTTHVAFERIHPFVDGNGRTGRMLMWWHEAQLDLVPTLITYDDRFKYYDWFR